MKKEKTTVGGWTVPGGKAGIAVRKACELVTSNPGISQAELLMLAVEFSGTNRAHMTWLTSPDAKRPERSPVGRLWERRKEGTWRCYPNSVTSQLSGSLEALRAYRLEEVRKEFRVAGGLPAPGSRVVVQVVGWGAMEPRRGIFLGVTWGDHNASTVEELVELVAGDEGDPAPRAYGGCHILFDGGETPRWQDPRRIPVQNISPEV
jgi:hypothetical protein